MIGRAGDWKSLTRSLANMEAGAESRYGTAYDLMIVVAKSFTVILRIVTFLHMYATATSVATSRTIFISQLLNCSRVIQSKVNTIQGRRLEEKVAHDFPQLRRASAHAARPCPHSFPKLAVCLFRVSEIRRDVCRPQGSLQQYITSQIWYCNRQGNYPRALLNLLPSRWMIRRQSIVMFRVDRLFGSNNDIDRYCR